MHEIWSVDSKENLYNCCYQMPSFKAEMHQIRFRLGLHPRPCWGSLQRSPRPPSLRCMGRVRCVRCAMSVALNGN